ncbi:MAG: hypothetical protein JWP29_4567 [Rhodoferax sp.]|nr:hypothetical protein [Rhodoferax sp.]
MHYTPPAHAKKKAAPVPGENAPETYVNGRGGNTLEADFQARSAGCTLAYRGTFRLGAIIYAEGVEGRPALCVVFRHQARRAHLRQGRFIVHLPTAAQWEAATGTPLSRREDIVDFVAETVRREEAGSWRYVIGPDRITYY